MSLGACSWALSTVEASMLDWLTLARGLDACFRGPRDCRGLCCLPIAAIAQSYPSRPVKIVVPFPPAARSTSPPACWRTSCRRA